MSCKCPKITLPVLIAATHKNTQEQKWLGCATFFMDNIGGKGLSVRTAFFTTILGFILAETVDDIYVSDFR